MPSLSQVSVMLDVKFKADDGYLLQLSVNRFSECEKFTSTFANIRGIEKSKLRFMNRGRELDERRTPDELGWRRNEVIEVLQIYF